MPYFRSQASPPRLPEGYLLAWETLPVDVDDVQALLERCGAPIRPMARLALALERSSWSVRVRDPDDRLVGFLRITSDGALNANLWDLAVDPAVAGRQTVMTVLIHSAVSRLRRELTGCSISLAAPPDTLDVLENQGFLVDPNGIRAMGLVLGNSSD
ncbi:MAG: N-acetyltransferase [Prochlorococcaceae cyanobacterium]